jgi:hypothetical protein
MVGRSEANKLLLNRIIHGTPEASGSKFQLLSATPKRNYRDSPELVIDINTPTSEKVISAVKKSALPKKNGTPGFEIEDSPQQRFDWQNAFRVFLSNFLPPKKNPKDEDVKRLNDLKSRQAIDLAEFVKSALEKNGKGCDLQKFQEIEDFWKKAAARILGKKYQNISDEDLSKIADNISELKPMILALKTAQWAYSEVVRNDEVTSNKLSEELVQYSLQTQEKMISKGSAAFDKRVKKATKDFLQTFETKKPKAPAELLQNLLQNIFQEEELRNELKNKSENLLKSFKILDKNSREEIRKQDFGNDVSGQLFKSLFSKKDYKAVIDKNFTNENSESSHIQFNEIVRAGKKFNEQIKDLLGKQNDDAFRKGDLSRYSKDVREAYQAVKQNLDIGKIVLSLKNEADEEDLNVDAANAFLTELFSEKWKSVEDYFRDPNRKFSPALEEKIRDGLKRVEEVTRDELNKQIAQQRAELERALVEKEVLNDEQLLSPENSRSSVDDERMSESSFQTLDQETITDPSSTRRTYHRAAFNVMLNDLGGSLDSLEISASVDGNDALRGNLQFLTFPQTPNNKTPSSNQKIDPSVVSSAIDSAFKALDQRGGSAIKKQLTRLQFLESSVQKVVESERKLEDTPTRFTPSNLRMGRSDSYRYLSPANLFPSQGTPQKEILTSQKEVMPREWQTPNASEYEASNFFESDERFLKAKEALTEAYNKLWEIEDEGIRNNIIALSLGHRSAEGLERQRKTKFTTKLIEVFIPLSFNDLSDALTVLQESFEAYQERDATRDASDKSETAVDKFSRFVCQVGGDISNTLVEAEKKLQGLDDKSESSASRALLEVSGALEGHKKSAIQEFLKSGLKQEQIDGLTRNAGKTENPSSEITLRGVIKDKEKGIARPVFYRYDESKISK